MPFYQFEGITPVVSMSSYVHESAEVIGDVIIEDNVYIAPLAVLRGDFGRIIVKQGANIQDNCVVHGFPMKDTIIDIDAHIGHAAIIHGCYIGKNVLIGMNSVIMDEAIIGQNSIVGALSFVKKGDTFADNSLILGSPAQEIRSLKTEEITWKSQGTNLYHELTVRSQKGLKKVTPLTEVEVNRKRLVWKQYQPKNS